VSHRSKIDINRRDFLRISGFGAAGVLCSSNWAKAVTPTADFVLNNGKIITMDSTDSVCEAVAVRRGKILAAGSHAEVFHYVGAATEVMDLKGKTVTPGLVDAHAHLPYFGLRENGWFLKLQGLYSKEEILDELAQRARVTPKGDWISAWGVESLSLSFITKEDLDRVTKDHPMLVVFTGGQWGFANSRALSIAGIDTNTPDPPGAKIGKASPGGEPSGLLIHYPALHLVRRHMPAPDEAQAQAALLFAAEMYAAEGVTTVHDNFVSPIHTHFHKGYFELASSNRLPVRVKLWPYMPNPKVSSSFCLSPMSTPPRWRFGNWFSTSARIPPCLPLSGVDSRWPWTAVGQAPCGI
jgi:predicted amidohydrolase YtcJ